MSFDQASHRTKRRRVDELVASTSAEAITKAAEKFSAASNSGTISVEKALALYVDMDLSFRQYNMMRNVVNAVHKNCFPSYYSIVEAKKKFIPDGIKVSETEAHVPLQAILDKTTNSILNKLEFGAENNVILECKWGFDGSSGHSIYKQKFESQDATDEFLFVASFVPLRIMEDKNEKILWQNNRHSSLRLCRPLKILFTKENSELIMKVKDNIHREIEQLTTYVYNNDKKKIKVEYRLKLTMIDGAVLNAIHGHKSCATCVLCGAKPTQMNTELVLERNVNENCYKYGLSTLHAWIKFFECIVHIAYKLPIKSWRIVDEQNKRVVAENKEKIQKKFKDEIGLIVDVIKTGYGTSNDGNTARRFFSNIEQAAQITGVDKTLINNFSVILRTLSSGLHINVTNFEKLLKETFILYIKLYPWYYMPVTVHKVLVHGISYIKYSNVPIGMLSEEAIESCHKVIRSNRLRHTRKTSRVDSNRDLIHYLILQSEPDISMNSQKIKIKRYDLNEIKDFVFVEDESIVSEDDLCNSIDVVTFEDVSDDNS